ncbi:hypothetical protein AURDEDRAFT_127192 [Auricularia subglabra TFB-10046 SS5]|nr:hypothetical protein AURDEDRAFT_127192 [Auricularia subglabra TFB-10046 SS5]
MAGWPNAVLENPNVSSGDLHPSQVGRRWLHDGPYEAAARERCWEIPKKAHPLSLLLAQLARPKFCSSERWIEGEENPRSYYVDSLRNPKFEHIKVFSADDGSPLGTIRSLDLDAVRKLAKASPFGMGAETVYDDAVRRGLEVRAAQLQLGLVNSLWPPGGCYRNGAWYFSDIAFQVGRFLFPGARAVKLVLYKLAIYTPGGHFKMHKDTTHTDSHVGTVLVGCGVVQDDSPGDEEWERLDYDFSAKVKKDGYSGGDLVILDHTGEEQRYHIRPGQVLAFCTDVPHAVDVVTSGTKLTLQFEVYLEDTSVPRENTVACVDLAEWDSFYGIRSCTGSDVEAGEGGETATARAPPSPPICSSCMHRGCMASEEKIREEADSLKNDPEGYWSYDGGAESFNSYYNNYPPGMHWRREENAFGRYPAEICAQGLDRFVAHLVSLLEKAPSPPAATDAYAAPRTVAFLLSHMYRKSSIRPEYLKTIDAAVYLALIGTKKLRVILHHVTYKVIWSSETGVHHQVLALCPPFTTGFSPCDIAEPVLCLHRPGCDEMRLRTEQSEMIARGELYTGNDAQEEPSWYVAGAMFVSLL